MVGGGMRQAVVVVVVVVVVVFLRRRQMATDFGALALNVRRMKMSRLGAAVGEQSRQARLRTVQALSLIHI
eukprot:242263-Lingulodinium_polyedra.AAC.1